VRLIRSDQNSNKIAEESYKLPSVTIERLTMLWEQTSAPEFSLPTSATKVRQLLPLISRCRAE
jgi:hypothetical protein